MSRLAPFVDAASAIDATNWDNTFLSYYTYGAALGLGLDLVAARPDQRQGDARRFHARAVDEIRARRRRAPGLVATPYTLADARATLAEVSGDKAFAETFFRSYVEGHEVVDYGRLLARAGLRAEAAACRPCVDGRGALRGRRIGRPRHRRRRAWARPPRTPGSARATCLSFARAKPVASRPTSRRCSRRGSPARPSTRAGADRAGRELTLRITLAADPQQEIVTIESTGAALTPEQQQFRDAWVKSRVR